MKRLLEEVELDTADRQLAEVFRSAPPFELDPFRKRRVLVGLERSQQRALRRFWLKPAVVAFLLVSGMTMAALGHRYVARGLVSLGVGSAPQAALVHSVAVPRATAPRPFSVAAPDSSVTAPAEPEPVPSARATLKGLSRARPESAKDATRVVEAIHPQGVLSEDALALSIEAASAQHDPRAAGDARRYLTRFPNGKYRTLANRALENAAATLP